MLLRPWLFRRAGSSRFRCATVTRRAGFPKGWYCVAESKDITDGVLKPVTYLDQQLIVYRDANGDARVADAYCPHLGAHLASHDGCITGGELVCPFHKWRFDGATGKCNSIPYTNVVPPQAKLALYPDPGNLRDGVDVVPSGGCRAGISAL